MPSGIYLVTHPRAASTALERSFMTQDCLECFHEPFGDPFYFGPERMSERFTPDEIAASEYQNTTFQNVVNSMSETGARGKSVFLKDMAQYIIPPEDHLLAKQPVPGVAKSFNLDAKASEANSKNPTVIPEQFLKQFRYIVLIRPPHLAVPSYLTQCKPPRSQKTGFHFFNPNEMGYRELRIFFDYITSNPEEFQAPLVIDAMDLIRSPEGVMRRVCQHIGIEFSEKLLSWDSNDTEIAKKFEKWNGWHDDVLKSSCFKATKTVPKEFVVDFESWKKDWQSKFDEKQVETIQSTVEKNLDDYLYLRAKKIDVE